MSILMNQEIVRVIESAFKLIDKHGNDVESSFCENHTPYSTLLETCSFFKSMNFVDRIKLSTQVWCYLLEQRAADITNQIEADYDYDVVTSDIHSGRAVGILTDNLTGEIIGFVDFEELIAGEIIQHAYDVDGIKSYLVKKGVIASHHTIYSTHTSK